MKTKIKVKPKKINKYKVYKHFPHSRDKVKEFITLIGALDYCYDEYLDRYDAHAISIENSEGSIFELTYSGATDVDVQQCATTRELVIINDYLNTYKN